MEKFIPSSGCVLISPLAQKKSGLNIPGEKDERKGVVVAVGKPILGVFNGIEYLPPCKVGDTIYHAYQYEGDVMLKGIKHKLVKFDGILGIYGK